MQAVIATFSESDRTSVIDFIKLSFCSVARLIIVGLIGAMITHMHTPFLIYVCACVRAGLLQLSRNIIYNYGTNGVAIRPEIDLSQSFWSFS